MVLSFTCELCKVLVVLGLSHHCKTHGEAPITGAFCKYLQFLPGLFLSFIKRRTLYSVVLFPLFCQRHRAGYNFSTRKEEVDASLVHVYTFKPYASQPRPHAFYCLHVYSHYLCDLMGPGRATRPDQHRQRLGLHCSSPGVRALRPTPPWATTRPLLMAAPRSSPSHWALHIPFSSCRWIHLVPEEQSSNKPQLGPCVSDSCLYQHSLRVFVHCHEIRFGEKNSTGTFHL